MSLIEALGRALRLMKSQGETRYGIRASNGVRADGQSNSPSNQREEGDVLVQWSENSGNWHSNAVIAVRFLTSLIRNI